MRQRWGGAGLIALLALLGAAAQAQTQNPTPAAAAPPFSRDSTYFAPDGTAYIQRIVPIPPSLSAQARDFLKAEAAPSSARPPMSLEDSRRHEAQRVKRDGVLALRKYPATLSEAVIAGVPVTVFRPKAGAGPVRPFVLINVHGGAFIFDCCSEVESVPLANLTRSEVISVGYRLAPEHPFPAAVDDVIAVYREVLKTHPASAVAIYGTSSGAVITGEVAVALKRRGLPEPGALGIFSGFGDFAMRTDTRAIFSLVGLGGAVSPQEPLAAVEHEYLGGADPTDPRVSPIRGDLSGLPPTLFLTGTRDAFLSGVSLFERAMIRAGDDPQLVVFEGLPHAFWVEPDLPEADEADRIMARFFLKHLRAGAKAGPARP